MQTENPIIELKNLNLELNKKFIIKNINLKVFQGEKIALLGLSGSGKTSLIHILCFGIKPSSGKILFKNIDLWNLTKSKFRNLKKDFFLIPQQMCLPLNQSIIDSVKVGLINNWSIIKVIFSFFFSFEEKKITSVLKSLNLDHKLFSKVKFLSGGEKQCISVSRLLVSKSSYVFADEPLTSLDKKKSDLVIKRILDHKKKYNATLICSLHQINFAKKYFSRIIGIKNGIIFFDLPVKKVTLKKVNELYKN